MKQKLNDFRTNSFDYTSSFSLINYSYYYNQIGGDWSISITEGEYIIYDTQFDKKLEGEFILYNFNDRQKKMKNQKLYN